MFGCAKNAIVLLGVLVPSARAFVAPVTFLVATDARTAASHLNSLPQRLIESSSFFLLSDEPSLDVIGSEILQNENYGGIMETVTTILTGIVGVIFFLVGLTYVMAAVIIPQAAQQLEQQTKELDPDLWNLYATKLEPGQTLDQRPDLMQELGEKMQKLMEAKFNEQQQSQAKSEDTGSATSSQVMDAEIVSEEPKKQATADDPWT
jgi:hypothetical protein